MDRENRPHVKVTILPDVYDPERYHRGMALLRSAYTTAVTARLGLLKATKTSISREN